MFDKTDAAPSGSASPETKHDVAVVIVTYKTAALTVECLRSVAAERAQQPQVTVRAVVVDNASGDSTTVAAAIAANQWSSWATVVTAPKNGGFAYGNNVGIERAYADRVPDYIYLLNPDTEVRAGAIKALVDFLETHLKVGIAGSSFENLDGSDWPVAFHFPSLLSEIESGLNFAPATKLLARWQVARTMTAVDQPVDWICGASMMIRRAVIDTIGGLDENFFLYYEETDFCRRSLEAGFETWYVPESRVMHIMGQSTKVTSVKPGRKRLPAYWFDSRRRYFLLSFGLAKASIIDVVAILACSLGALKRRVLRRAYQGVPHYVGDLVRSSIIWRRNRDVPPARCAIPRQSQ